MLSNAALNCNLRHYDLAYNARSSLTVKMNGWGGLANARVTIFGDVHRLPQEYQTAANEIFKAKYEARPRAASLRSPSAPLCTSLSHFSTLFVTSSTYAAVAVVCTPATARNQSSHLVSRLCVHLSLSNSM